MKIDDKPVDRADQFWIHGVPDPQSKLCSELYVSFYVELIDETSQKPLLEGEHTLTLVNSDGQAADVRFPVDPMSIDSVEPQSLTPGNSEVEMKITGKNFGENTTTEWRPPGSDSDKLQKLEGDAFKRITATEVRLKLVPGEKTGTGKLTLVSAAKLRASKDLQVKAEAKGPTSNSG